MGTKRYDSNSGGEREIQRTMLELLNQLDGFDSRGDVKVTHLVTRIFALYICLVIGRFSLIFTEFVFGPPSLSLSLQTLQLLTSKYDSNLRSLQSLNGVFVIFNLQGVP